ncbi:MAG: hypothetical protein ABS75_28165 [Pelagibacterium sp. SCN 63-23]|nr:MAG: hypothetical protein ABS75_28165 [Pelagibacterium sp. SCN 63-23]
MRAGLTLLAVLALAAQPALAQSKTKPSTTGSAVAALEMCEAFAAGHETIMDEALDAGWDAYEQEPESPFVKGYDAGRDLPGLGWADLFALVETYPGKGFGYCRIDVATPRGSASAVIDAIVGLDRYEGDVVEQDGGVYASLENDSSLLLTHFDEYGFVIQLTTLTPADGE